MLVHIYAGAGEAWLLLPDVMEPSQDAVHRFGPLRYRGAVFADVLSEEMLQRALADFDSKSFALISADMAAGLLQVADGGGHRPPATE